MRILICIFLMLISLLVIIPAEAQRRMLRRKAMRVNSHPIKLHERKQSKRNIEYFKKNKSTLGTASINKKKASTKKSVGRGGKQNRLKALEHDDKQPRYIKGQIKRDRNEIKRGKRTSVRNPVGHDLAHHHNKPAKAGNDYEHSKLQSTDIHKSQHKNEKKLAKRKKAAAPQSPKKRK